MLSSKGSSNRSWNGYSRKEKFLGTLRGMKARDDSHDTKAFTSFRQSLKEQRSRLDDLQVATRKYTQSVADPAGVHFGELLVDFSSQLPPETAQVLATLGSAIKTFEAFRQATLSECLAVVTENVRNAQLDMDAARASKHQLYSTRKSLESAAQASKKSGNNSECDRIAQQWKKLNRESPRDMVESVAHGSVAVMKGAATLALGLTKLTETFQAASESLIDRLREQSDAIQEWTDVESNIENPGQSKCLESLAHQPAEVSIVLHQLFPNVDDQLADGAQAPPEGVEIGPTSTLTDMSNDSESTTGKTKLSRRGSTFKAIMDVLARPLWGLPSRDGIPLAILSLCAVLESRGITSEKVLEPVAKEDTAGVAIAMQAAGDGSTATPDLSKCTPTACMSALRIILDSNAKSLLPDQCIPQVAKSLHKGDTYNVVLQSAYPSNSHAVIHRVNKCLQALVAAPITGASIERCAELVGASCLGVPAVEAGSSIAQTDPARVKLRKHLIPVAVEIIDKGFRVEEDMVPTTTGQRETEQDEVGKEAKEETLEEPSPEQEESQLQVEEASQESVETIHSGEEDAGN